MLTFIWVQGKLWCFLADSKYFFYLENDTAFLRCDTNPNCKVNVALYFGSSWWGTFLKSSTASTEFSKSSWSIQTEFIDLVNWTGEKLNWPEYEMIPVDTGRKLNVHKKFSRRPGRLLNALGTFNLCPVSMGEVLSTFYQIYQRVLNIAS